MDRTRLARLLIALPALFLVIGPPIADFNASHATNPSWPPHARLHMVWLVCTNALVALLALGVLWRKRAPEPAAIRQAAVLVGAILAGFFAAALAMPGYGGGLSDPDGVQVRAGPLDANLVGFGVCAALVVAACVLVRVRRPGA